MRVISVKTLKEFWRRHADAEGPLLDWYEVTERARWRNFVEVKQTFGTADAVKVASGNTVTVFDIGGNKYRLIAAIHYNAGVVYALMVLTHREYDTSKWKARL